MKKIISLVIVVVCMLSLTACKNKIETIKIVEDSVPAVININDVDSAIASIKLEVTKSKGEVEIINLEKSMISEEDYKKLSNAGYYTITINYEEFKTNLTLTIEDPNAYSVKVVYPNGEPVTGGVSVQWCTATSCLPTKEVMKYAEELRNAGYETTGYQADVREAERLKAIYKEIFEKYGRIDAVVNAAGVAYNKLDDSKKYFIHIEDIPAGYTYDPNIYTTDKDNKKVEIKLITLNETTGEGTLDNPYVVSVGGANVNIESASLAGVKYFAFTPSEAGTYSIKSLAVDKFAMNAIDPYIGFLGDVETDITKADVKGNVAANINFNHTFTAEANVTYLFIVFVTSATKFPASFDIVISK